MDDDKYFVICPDYEGGLSVRMHDKVGLEKWLAEKLRDAQDGCRPPAFVSQIPDGEFIDEEKPLPHAIIKGRFVLPKAQEVVTRYEI